MNGNIGHVPLPPIDRCDVAGVGFDFIPQDEVLQHVLKWRALGQRRYVTLTNPHSVMLARRDAAMRDATADAHLTLPDGGGVVLAAKLLGYGRQHRVTGPSLMLRLCDLGRKHGLRHFFYGGGPGIAAK